MIEKPNARVLVIFFERHSKGIGNVPGLAVELAEQDANDSLRSVGVGIRRAAGRFERARSVVDYAQQDCSVSQR